MSILLLLTAFGKRAVVPQTYTVNLTSTQSFTVPAGVTTLDLSGKGQDGMPARSDPDIPMTVTVARVIGDFEGVGSSPTLSNWDRFTLHANTMQQKINNGGSGSDAQGLLHYVQYETSSTGGGRRATLTTNSVTWTDVVAGSASASFIAWTQTGAVQAGDSGEARVNYLRRGTQYPATTGLSASGFGKTFPGGAGGPAVVTGFTSVPVTPGASYQVTVPTGGNVTVTYKK